MSHLIQPVTIDGTKHCIKHGATTPKWRTVSILSEGTELVGAENGDAWQKAGFIKFGTSCLWKFTLTVTQPDLNDIGFVLEANGGEIISDFGTPPLTAVVDLNALGLMGRACGTVFVLALQGGDTIQAEITDVTFGPPV